ncbi:CaiB/BaiF CoA-transferase family protein [Bartonella sp. LJL80]
MTARKPLADFVIVEQLCGEIASVGKLLAEFGAEVIRLEPQQGLPDRREQTDPSHIIDFHIHNAGKQSMVCTLTNSPMDEIFNRADAFIFDPTIKSDMNVDIETYRLRYPHLLLVSVSPFGSNTRISSWKGSALIYSALSGELARSGYGMREPILPPGELTVGCAAAQAFFAVVTGLYDCLLNAAGRAIDFSILDGASQALDPGFGITGSSSMGATAEILPRQRPTISSYPIISCADGRIRLCILSPRQWEGFREWLGNPAEFMDKSFYDINVRFKSPELTKFINAFFEKHTTKQAVEESKGFHVPCATVRGLVAAIENEHVKARGSFSHRTLSETLTIPMPNGMVTIDGQRMAVEDIAPDLGTFNISRLQKLKRGEPVSNRQHNRARPLEGIRILDLGVIVVGADTAKLLADLGAQVIKVEDHTHLDGSRLSGDMSWSFHLGHRNKKSLGINLKTQEGHNLFMELAKDADVILSNFKPGTLDKMGLSYEVISQVNPGIIMVDSSAFGSSGPWADRMGYGPLVRAKTGLTTLWGYADDHSLCGDSITIYPDHVGARIGAACVISLLIRRLKDGKGGSATIAQSEIALNHLATLIAIEAAGAENRLNDVPNGIYPARGYDEWVAISVSDNTEFEKLLGIIADPLLQNEDYATFDGRRKHRQSIEECIKRWLLTLAPEDAETRLQQAGIACAHMKHVQDLPGLDYFVDRDFFRTEHNPLLPERTIVAEKQPFISDIALDVPNLPAPGFAANTIEIAKNLLHLDDQQIAACIAKDILQIHSSEKQ